MTQILAWCGSLRRIGKSSSYTKSTGRFKVLLLRWQELLALHQVSLPLPPLSRLGGNEQKGLASWMPEFCKSILKYSYTYLSLVSMIVRKLQRQI